MSQTVDTSNKEFQDALSLIQYTRQSVFLTGKAGTGKSTFLRYICENIKKKHVVLAPTGIAAINAGGSTLHSFFKLPFHPLLPDDPNLSLQRGRIHEFFRYTKPQRKLLEELELIIIDEISMVRADIIDAVDRILRVYSRNLREPFGGKQLLLVGDVFQLEPVVKGDEREILNRFYPTPYFFSARVFNQIDLVSIELEKVYRQTDKVFVSVLDHIRSNTAGTADLQLLNTRYGTDIEENEEDMYITLATRRDNVDYINDRKLAELPGDAVTFRGEVTGDFPESSLPTSRELVLKPGAQVIFIKNDFDRRWVNGTIGVVSGFDEIEETLYVITDDGKECDVKPEHWKNIRYKYNEKKKEIEEEVLGTFSQFPVRLAWAITVHKSQGLTFERAIIDASASFAHGQTYVALSRCKTLEGLVLSAPLSARAVISDSAVDTFTEDARRNEPDETRYRRLQQAYFLELLSGLFDFLPLELTLKRFVRLVDEHLYKLYPKLLTEYKSETERFHEKVTKVAQKFSLQYTRLVDGAENYATDKSLQERIHLGAEYFKEQLEPLDAIRSSTIVETDNKELKKQLKTASEELDDLLLLKVDLLEFVISKGFHVGEYLKQKAVLSIDDTASTKGKGEKRSGNSTERRKRKGGTEESGNTPARKKTAAVEVPSDILHPELYRRLVAWRNAEASQLGLPVYTVIQQKAILGITNLLPEDKSALLRIPYFGKKGVEKYGDELLEMVRVYKKESGIAETLFSD